MGKESEKKKGVLGAVDFAKEPRSNAEIRDPMFVGVDPSYNGFGIIVLDRDGNIIEQRLITSKSELEVEERIIELEKKFDFIPKIMGLHSVYVEGPSYGSNGAFVLQMGALHFYLRIFLYKNNVRYNIIAPGTLKKFVTGKGTAKKELMLKNVFKRWGADFDDNNLADAYSLARYALKDYKNNEDKNKIN